MVRNRLTAALRRAVTGVAAVALALGVIAAAPQRAEAATFDPSSVVDYVVSNCPYCGGESHAITSGTFIVGSGFEGWDHVECTVPGVIELTETDETYGEEAPYGAFTVTPLAAGTTDLEFFNAAGESMGIVYDFTVVDLAGDEEALLQTIGYPNAHPNMQEGVAEGIVTKEYTIVLRYDEWGGISDQWFGVNDALGAETYQTLFDAALEEDYTYNPAVGEETMLGNGNTYAFVGWSSPVAWDKVADASDFTYESTYTDPVSGLQSEMYFLYIDADWDLVSEGTAWTEPIDVEIPAPSGTYAAGATLSATRGDLETLYKKAGTEGVMLKVEDSPALGDAQQGAISAVVAKGSTLVNSFDVTLQNYGGEDIALTSEDGVTVTVHITLTDAMIAAGTDNLVVYYVADDGTMTAMKSWVEDGTLNFTTDHLSTYVVMAAVDESEPPAPTEEPPATTETPKQTEQPKADVLPATGDPALLAVAVTSGTGALALAGAAVATMRRKR